VLFPAPACSCVASRQRKIKSCKNKK
jgi:hypothetical protein